MRTIALAGLASLAAAGVLATPVVLAADEEPDAGTRSYQYRVTVKAGQEVLARDHHNWTRMCKPQDNRPIKITRPPTSGTVAVRPGDFEVKRSLSGNEVCFGRVMPGNGVYYKAGPSPGTDSFHYQVETGTKTRYLLEFEVQVTIE